VIKIENITIRSLFSSDLNTTKVYLCWSKQRFVFVSPQTKFDKDLWVKAYNVKRSCYIACAIKMKLVTCHLYYVLKCKKHFSSQRSRHYRVYALEPNTFIMFVYMQIYTLVDYSSFTDFSRSAQSLNYTVT